MKFLGMGVALLAAGAFSLPASAQNANLGRNLAATCANCHGTDGRSVGGPEVLAGMPKDQMVQKMKEFKSGTKPATIMHQLSKGYTDQQVELIAEFFAQQKAR